MNKFKVFLPILPLLITACSSFRTNQPYAVVENPEVAPYDNLNWEAVKVSGSEEYIISSDASDRPPVFNAAVDNHIKTSTTASGSLNYTFVNNLEVGISGGSEGGLKLKYQFLDTNPSVKSEKYLGSVFGRYTTLMSGTSGDQNGTFGVGGHPWQAKSDVTNKNIGISFGYKPTDKLTWYTGLAYNDLSMNGEINQSTSNDGTSPAASYSIKAIGHSRTASLGFIFGKDSKLDISANTSNMNFGNTTRHNNYFNLAYSKNFEGLLYGKEPEYELIPKESWKGRDIGALALSVYVGFGSGQAVQKNWNNSGQNFAMADGAGLAMMLFSAPNAGGTIGSGQSVGATIFLVSRIWQIVDVIIDASRENHKKLKTIEPTSTPKD